VGKEAGVEFVLKRLSDGEKERLRALKRGQLVTLMGGDSEVKRLVIEWFSTGGSGEQNRKRAEAGKVSITNAMHIIDGVWQRLQE
jgi:hypothetical protein